MKRRVVLLLSAFLVCFGSFGATRGYTLPEEDAMCVTAAPDSPGTFYHGPSASYLYDANFAQGVDLPEGMALGSGASSDPRFVPQGLAVWHNWRGGTSTEDLFLISAYEWGSSTESRSAIFGLVAGSTNTSRGRAFIAAGHVGGIAVVGSWIYVGSGNEIRAYRASDLRSFLDGPNSNLTLDDVPSRGLTVGANYLNEVSYLGEGNGVVWVGEFTDPDRGRMYKLTQASDGSLALPAASSYTPTPRKTQGVAVTSDRFIYSTSLGRDNRSNVWVVNRAATEGAGSGGSVTDGNSFCVRAPSMAEGVAIWDESSPKRVAFVFESAAFKYRNGDGDGFSRNSIPELHRIDVPDLGDLYTIYRDSD